MGTVCRFGQIVRSYVLASAVAALVIAVAFVPVIGPFALAAFFYALPAVAVCALVPAIVLIAYAERHGPRSASTYVLSGAAIGLIAGVGFALVIGRLEFALIMGPVCGVAGAIAGAVYRSIAGDAAGAHCA